MRKVLLTVMMVSSLLAFNACKKDGATGPAGATGATGPAGPTGTVGPQGVPGVPGAAGVAGSKILAGTVAPTTEGAVGDYYFDKTSKTLWGPKVAAGWAGTNVALTGAPGVNGTQFLAGAGAPTAATGVTGDFYFDTTTGTFYGPKQADGTFLNALPLGLASAAKTYNITRGFEILDSTRTFGTDLVPTYTGFNIFSTYKINTDDLVRIANYKVRADGTGGYSENREMVFESAPGSNIFNDVAVQALDLGASTDEIATIVNAANTIGKTNMRVGAKFRYSKNTVQPLAEFTLNQADIDRLKVNSGAAFGYLTYAKADPTTLGVGANVVFATNKNVQVKPSTTRYYASYKALTRFDLNALVPNLEKYKQDGKVFLKYRYYNTRVGNNATTVNHPGVQAGWADITNYANSYAAAGTVNTTAHTTTGISDVNPFGIATGAGLSGYGGAYTPVDMPGGLPVAGSYLGAIGSSVTLANNQVAFVNNVTTGTPVANRTTNLNGNVVINWNIASGTFNAAASTYIGPDQIQNAGNVSDPVTIAASNPFGPAALSASFIVRGGPAVNTPLTTYNYYSSLVAPNATLTATNAAGAPIVIGAGDLLSAPDHKGGQPSSYFKSYNLVKLQVFVIPGDTIKELRAKGVNVDDINEVSKYVKL